MAHQMLTKSVIVGILFFLFQGCSGISAFPENGAQKMASESEFGLLTAQPDVYKGQAIKLAGRIVGVETSNHGTLITAEWLPYPGNENYEPVQASGASSDQFIIFYPGPI